MTLVRGSDCERVIDNIAAWRDGEAYLDVRALYAKLAEMYEPDSATNWCALLLFDLYSELKDLEQASSVSHGIPHTDVPVTKDQTK